MECGYGSVALPASRGCSCGRVGDAQRSSGRDRSLTTLPFALDRTRCSAAPASYIDERLAVALTGGSLAPQGHRDRLMSTTSRTNTSSRTRV